MCRLFRWLRDVFELLRRFRFSLRFFLEEENEGEVGGEEELSEVPLEELALACFRHAHAAWVMNRKVCLRS